MKRVMVGMLVVMMLATPCVGEVEPSSIEGTLWEICYRDPPTYRYICSDFTRGFSRGVVYECDAGCVPFAGSYIDMPFVSIVYFISEDPLLNSLDIGWLFPGLGTGWILQIPLFHIQLPDIRIMQLLNATWSPPSE